MSPTRTAHSPAGRRGPRLLALLAASALALTACVSGSPSAAPTPSETQQSEDPTAALVAKWNETGVKVAVGSSLPNSSINPDGTPAGVEPEVTAAAFTLLGITNVQFQQVDYATMIPGLQASQFDVVAGALYMNETRCAAAAISEPIVVGTYSFLHAADLANPPATLADLAKAEDLKVGIISGSLQLKAAIAAGVSEDRILQVANVRDEVDALTQNRVQVTIENTAALKGIVGEDASVTITAPVPDLPHVGSGAIFRPTDEALRDAFNTALAEVKADGTYATIAKAYGVDPSVTLDGPTGAELCKNPG